VQALQQTLVNLVQSGLPTSLLTILLAIERRYRYDLENRRGTWGPWRMANGQSVQVYYAPWMWRQVYALARLKSSYSQAKQVLADLEKSLLGGRINDLGLAAKWAQWLTRRIET